MKKKRYEMTLIFDGFSEHFSFWSIDVIKDGEHNSYLDQVMNDWLEENLYDENDELPIDYVIDTYENWCFIQGILEQEETRNSAEDVEWAVFLIDFFKIF